MTILGFPISGSSEMKKLFLKQKHSHMIGLDFKNSNSPSKECKSKNEDLQKGPCYKHLYLTKCAIWKICLERRPSISKMSLWRGRKPWWKNLRMKSKFWSLQFRDTLSLNSHSNNKCWPTCFRWSRKITPLFRSCSR